MHHDEIDIAESLVRKLLHEQFPQWAKMPIARVSSPSTVNAIFRLGDDMSVRLPRTPRFHDIDKELCWLHALSGRLPLAIPEALAVGEPGDAFPWKWGVFRWIEGEPWGEDARDSSAEAMRLAEFLHALESLDPATIPCPSMMHAGGLADGDQVMRTYAKLAARWIDTGSVLRAWDRALKAPDWDQPPLAVHSDMMAGNLLVRNGRLTAVIDWASAHAGDPASDLQLAWRLLSGEARRVFRREMGFDDATWSRARGWVLRSVIGVVYYAETNPSFAAENLTALQAALAYDE
jgi:aminoglycoside phosphotransferase (APT) family kinase protein